MRRGISFSGSGHLLCYHIGVARTLITEGNDAFAHVSGSSGGAVTAAVATTLSPADVHRFAIDYAVCCKALSGVRDMLPDDAHERAARANVHVGVTTCESGEPALLNTFVNRQQLVDSVFASCRFPRSFHPLDFWRHGPRYPAAEGKEIGGTCYVDGALSSALPIPPMGEDVATLRVSVMAAPSEARLLCPAKPSRTSHGLPNLSLGHKQLLGLPVHLCVSNVQNLHAGAFGASARALERLYDAGRSDAERFLRERSALEW